MLVGVDRYEHELGLELDIWIIYMRVRDTSWYLRLVGKGFKS